MQFLDCSTGLWRERTESWRYSAPQRKSLHPWACALFSYPRQTACTRPWRAALTATLSPHQASVSVCNKCKEGQHTDLVMLAEELWRFRRGISKISPCEESTPWKKAAQAYYLNLTLHFMLGSLVSLASEGLTFFSISWVTQYSWNRGWYCEPKVLHCPALPVTEDVG